MEILEGLVVVSLNPCRPVCFVGDRQVEDQHRAKPLSRDHLVQGLVGAEHGSHAVAVLQVGRDLLRVGRHGAHERVDPGLVALAAAARASVRAHDQGSNGAVGVGQPRVASLRHQRDRRRGEQHPSPVWYEALGDLERHERLPGAARHDQLASVVPLRIEPVHHGLDGLEALPVQDQGDRGLRHLQDLPVCIVHKVDPMNRDQQLAGHGLLRASAPRTGDHHPALGERFAAGLRQEAIYIVPRDPPVLGIELALDGHPLAPVEPGHQVDAHVAPVEASERLTFGPVPPCPNVLDLERGFLSQKLPRQRLEPLALLAFAAAVGPDAGERLAHRLGGTQVELRLALSGMFRRVCPIWAQFPSPRQDAPALP